MGGAGLCDLGWDFGLKCCREGWKESWLRARGEGCLREATFREGEDGVK